MAQVTVIQVLRRETVGSTPDYNKILLQNAAFLKQYGVEYFVVDTLKSFQVVQKVKQIADITYFRTSFKDAMSTLSEFGTLANGEKIVFLKSEDLLNGNNVATLEASRPNFYKKDIGRLAKLKKKDFNFDDFNLLFKENKTLWEKVKVLFI
jgi:hypothetical protein